MIILNYICIGLGGALGAITRVALGKLLPNAAFGIPLQILCINVLGCFLMGLIIELFAVHGTLSENLRYLLISGFLGGFTTFSAFALEFGLLYEKHLYLPAMLYAFISCFLSILCFFLGIKCMRLFF